MLISFQGPWGLILLNFLPVTFVSGPTWLLFWTFVFNCCPTLVLNYCLCHVDLFVWNFCFLRTLVFCPSLSCLDFFVVCLRLVWYEWCEWCEWREWCKLWRRCECCKWCNAKYCNTSDVSVVTVARGASNASDAILRVMWVCLCVCVSGW